MSGSGSRARRVAAVKRARDDVYSSRCSSICTPPFNNDRQNRIYREYYQKFYNQYLYFEQLIEEMESVYGAREYICTIP